MTVFSVLPRVTNHAGCLGGKQSLRPKMKAEKEAPSKAKIISPILLLVCLGFFNSGMVIFSTLEFALKVADIHRCYSFVERWSDVSLVSEGFHAYFTLLK